MPYKLPDLTPYALPTGVPLPMQSPPSAPPRQWTRYDADSARDFLSQVGYGPKADYLTGKQVIDEALRAGWQPPKNVLSQPSTPEPMPDPTPGSAHAAVKRVYDRMKAEGRTDLSPMDRLELASIIPGHMIQGIFDSLARGATAAPRAMSGEMPIFDPVTGHSSDEAIGSALDMAGLAATGGFAVGRGTGLAANAPRRPGGSPPPKTNPELIEYRRIQRERDDLIEQSRQEYLKRMQESPETFPDEFDAFVRWSETKENPFYDQLQKDVERYDQLYDKYGELPNDQQDIDLNANKDVTATGLAGTRRLPKDVAQEVDSKHTPEVMAQLWEEAETYAQLYGTTPEEELSRLMNSGRDIDLFANKGPAITMLTSAVDRAIEGSSQRSATGQQWLSFLKGRPGIKQEELDWRGIEEMLLANAEKPISRVDFQKFLKENEVKIEEKVRGENFDPAEFGLTGDDAREFLKKTRYIDPERISVLSDAEAFDLAQYAGWAPEVKKAAARTKLQEEYGQWEQDHNIHGDVNEILDDQFNLSREEFRERYRRDPLADEEVIFLRNWREAWNNPPVTQDRPKYESYIQPLPEGSNYREIQLMSPVKIPQDKIGVTMKPSGAYEYGLENRPLGTFTHPLNREGRPTPANWSEQEALAIARQLAKQRAEDKDPAFSYQSGHWPEDPNLVSWARVDDRIVPTSPNNMRPDIPTNVLRNHLDNEIYELERRLNDEHRNRLYLEQNKIWDAEREGKIDAAQRAQALKDLEKTKPIDSPLREYIEDLKIQRKGLPPPELDAPTEGLRTLFAHEVQSDWHQQGRKFGYMDEPPDPSKWTVRDFKGKWRVNDQAGTYLTDVTKTTAPTAEEALKVAIERRGERGGDQPVLPGPWRRSWQDLTLKRLMQEAVNKDYDALAWTTGDLQTQRWPRPVTRVTYDPRSERLIGYSRSGDFAFDEVVMPEHVRKYIGKDYAEQLLSQTPPETKGTIKKTEYGWEVRDANNHYIDEVDTQQAAKDLLEQQTTSPLKELKDINFIYDIVGMSGAYDDMLARTAKGLYHTPIERMKLSSGSKPDRLMTQAERDNIERVRNEALKVYDQIKGEANVKFHKAWKGKPVFGPEWVAARKEWIKEIIDAKIAMDKAIDEATPRQDHMIHLMRLTPELKKKLAGGQNLFELGLPLPQDDEYAEGGEVPRVSPGEVIKLRTDPEDGINWGEIVIGLLRAIGSVERRPEQPKMPATTGIRG